MGISDNDLYRGLLNTNPNIQTAYEYSDAEIDTLVAEDITVSYADLCIVAGLDMSRIIEVHRAGVPYEYLTVCLAAGRDIEWILEAHAADIPLEFGAA